MKLKGIPSSARIGFDDISSDSPSCVAAWKAGGRVVTRRIDPSTPEVADTLRDGIGCAAAAPARNVFTVRIDIPASLRKDRHAPQVIESLLDTKLAFPVDDSLYAIEMASSTNDAASHPATALVVRRSDFAQRLDALRAKGCDPEIVAPEALALWRRLATEHPSIDPATPCAVLRMGGDTWTLAAGMNGTLAAPISFPARDGATARRALNAIFPAGRADSVLWFPCGPRATLDADWAAFRDSAKLPQSVLPTIPDDSDSYLAGALAMLALDDRKPANLRPADNPPPGVVQKTARRFSLLRAAICTVCALLAAFDCVAVFFARQAEKGCEAEVHALASRLAGRTLNMRGPALVAAARQELDERLNPDIETWTFRNPLSALSETLRVAGLRDVALHSVRIEGGKITLAGTAATGADIDAIELVLKNAGFTAHFDRIDRDNAIAFSGSAMEVPL